MGKHLYTPTAQSDKHDRSATPDLMPSFQRQSRLTQAGSGGGRNMEKIITGARDANRAPNGAHCHLDGPASGMGARVSGGNLGTGGDSLRDAAGSIHSGAKAPKVNWLSVKRGGK
jgi:hypothetical protein